ncbi:MAG: hypothetical protein ABSB19_14120, partial [Methylomonas sp.]
MRVLKIAVLVLGTLLTVRLRAETVFITLEKDNALAVLDGLEGKLLKTVNIGVQPRGIVISPDAKVLYIAASGENTIKIIDTDTLKETGRLPSGE